MAIDAVARQVGAQVGRRRRRSGAPGSRVGHVQQRTRLRIALAEEQEIEGQVARHDHEVGLHVPRARPGVGPVSSPARAARRTSAPVAHAKSTIVILSINSPIRRSGLAYPSNDKPSTVTVGRASRRPPAALVSTMIRSNSRSCSTSNSDAGKRCARRQPPGRQRVSAPVADAGDDKVIRRHTASDKFAVRNIAGDHIRREFCPCRSRCLHRRCRLWLEPVSGERPPRITSIRDCFVGNSSPAYCGQRPSEPGPTRSNATRCVSCPSNC